MRESQYHILSDSVNIAICQQDYSGQSPDEMYDNVLFYVPLSGGIDSLLDKVKSVISVLKPYESMASVYRYKLQLDFILKSLDKKHVTTVDHVNIDTSFYDFLDF